MKNDKVGIYLRLSSSEDGNKESESISNQRKIIMKYLNDNNLIFIKEYIENYFPEHKIRYISIIDNIDTFEDDSQNDIAPFRSVMNEMYAKDISNKVKSSKRNMMQKGKWASGSVVYGYNLDVKNNVLIIDDEAAKIVRRIYNMFLDGKRIVDIKRILDAEGILPPGKYKKMKKITDAYEYWNTDRIKCILTNRVYKGDMVQHKTANISYKSKKKIYIPKEKQVIMENTHEPIIDKETFEKVQKKFTRKSDNKRKYQHLLKDYIYCEHCGRKLSIAVAKRKTTVDSYKVVCPLYEKDHNLCYKRYIDYRELEECILKNIKDTL